MKWVEKSFTYSVLVDSNGKILGEVSEVARNFRAFAKGNLIDCYLDRESAKKAVEKHIADYP